MRKQEKLQAQEERHKEANRNRFLLIASFVIPILLLGGIVAYALFYSTTEDIPSIGETIPEQGREHIAQGAAHPEYSSNPPASGWHYETWADWGVYSEEQSQELLIHNLEHGGIVIQYKPDVDKETIAKLEDLKKSEFSCKIVVAPYSKLDTNIALTAWTQLYKSDTYEEETIKNFIRKYRDKGPENVPCSVKPTDMATGQ